MLEFVSSGVGAFYGSNVIIDRNVDPVRVVSSKISAWSKDVVDSRHAIGLVDSLRDSANDAVPELRPIAYN